MLMELVCVNCPKGCRIQVEMEENKILSIEGNSCPKGKQYAESEIICPMRILTTTVKIEGGCQNVLPVVTEKEIPLAKMDEAMEEVRTIHVQSPVTMGQVIKEDLAHTGVRLLSSRSM